MERKRGIFADKDEKTKKRVRRMQQIEAPSKEQVSKNQ